MFKRFFNSLKSTGISPYIWTILAILPFYFIWQMPSTTVKVAGTILTLMFFLVYWLAFVSKSWTVYIWTCILIGISIASASLFSYVYFAFFIAYFIGNIKDRIPFLVLYFIHLVGTSIVINLEIVLKEEFFIKQLPIIVIVWISVILLPFSIYNRNKRGELEEKLEDANKRISELVKIEERQRIARDLHDTLGQKLSLIGLKSDLARKLIYKDPEQAREELKDVQQTARTALNEVRKMVAEMRGIRVRDELIHIKQILKAAEIKFVGKDEEFNINNVSLLSENILSMCLKEAVTNVVKHSEASICSISIMQTEKELIAEVSDNGVGNITEEDYYKGSGLLGMRERLEFVNGTLEIFSKDGIKLLIKIPKVLKQTYREDLI
ncbi:sensor histidine kinase [Mesobacillus subterraneus]|uniref:sensor histidine kinase n=1 Tax=Mesobacillus subterraneus TaxID=285983 RepID=UPI00203E34E5|nr:sensor histidine kinase [Mesobacillus subterraneus]MCM3664981.1 sensor histidine kinase [Mesobacillus subterraneus]MCM3682068.1 sensor histidine kinase [Mesobacillus subterraneus]